MTNIIKLQTKTVKNTPAIAPHVSRSVLAKIRRQKYSAASVLIVALVLIGAPIRELGRRPRRIAVGTLAIA